ncbi:hypothetical protein SAMN04489723_11635 [Algoriphagus aquimarinus]|uniref:Uncharacterized protein n=1 Tax=Algoriphagus aquimarinus TaxID=237018 RepID=A0A1I1BQH8_9BACT|nr:hypothetical protein SAMN04489723_11635 [Algoriphagus aquimarinus]
MGLFYLVTAYQIKNNMCVRLTARMYFIINAISSNLAIPPFQRGQGGFFTTKTIYNTRTCIHADTHKK